MDGFTQYELTISSQSSGANLLSYGFIKWMKNSVDPDQLASFIYHWPSPLLWKNGPIQQELTHISLASFLWDIDKQCRHRSDSDQDLYCLRTE